MGDRTVEPSAREFAPAEAFRRCPGRVLTRGWGLGFGPGSNAVDVYVRRLHREIGADRTGTLRGTGCRLRADGPRSPRRRPGSAGLAGPPATMFFLGPRP